jgi:hypothetical protein
VQLESRATRIIKSIILSVASTGISAILLLNNLDKNQFRGFLGFVFPFVLGAAIIAIALMFAVSVIANMSIYSSTLLRKKLALGIAFALTVLLPIFLTPIIFKILVHE